MSQASHTVEKWPQPSLRITWYLPLKKSPIFTWWYPPVRGKMELLTHTAINKSVCYNLGVERDRCYTLAVIIGVLLLIIIRAQDLFFLLWKRRISLAWLGTPTPTMWLWPDGEGDNGIAERSQLCWKAFQTNVQTDLTGKQGGKQGDTGEHWGPVEMLQHNVRPHVKDTKHCSAIVDESSSVVPAGKTRQSVGLQQHASRTPTIQAHELLPINTWECYTVAPLGRQVLIKNKL